MSFGILNNIRALQAEAALGSTQMELNTTLQQLATGQRINSGSTDPAGLAIANGLSANIAALNQSIQNANNGTGSLQVADGALSQVTSLLNTAVTHRSGERHREQRAARFAQLGIPADPK